MARSLSSLIDAFDLHRWSGTERPVWVSPFCRVAASGDVSLRRFRAALAAEPAGVMESCPAAIRPAGSLERLAAGAGVTVRFGVDDIGIVVVDQNVDRMAKMLPLFGRVAPRIGTA